MIEPFQLLESQTSIAPLGVKFWDVSTGAHVRGGLRVIAYPDGHTHHYTHAAANRSGAYVFHRAWGLSESPVTSRRYTILIHDQERRYLPVKFEADFPTTGLFQWPSSRPRTLMDPLDGSVPLYPSILSHDTAGMAVLRAELHESSGGKRAAWAMIEARFNGQLIGRGIADEQGRIALVFPYPPPQDSLSSPAGGVTTRLPFLKQEWTVQLQAFYEPAGLSSAPGSTRADRSVPALNDVFNQAPANVFPDQALTEPLTEVNLMYGPNPAPLSILFVSPAN